jgi:hypothetical protein
MPDTPQFKKDDKVLFNTGRGSFQGTVQGLTDKGHVQILTKDGKVISRRPEVVKRAFNNNE